MVLAACAPAPAVASMIDYCDVAAPVDPAAQDRIFRFAAVAKAELERSGRRLALVARSGLDLRRFGLRYSHAGYALQAHPVAPWAVRQLYYACDERRPRLYDQGLAGFLLGTDDPSLGYASFVLLPDAASDALARRVLDDRAALALLGARYSANAYAFSTLYQNCNQWVAELLATALGALDPAAPGLRPAAQQWLGAHGYRPTEVPVHLGLVWLAGFVPWVHTHDHPREDVDRLVYRVSMPDAIEAFVRAQVPGAQRIELCHAAGRIIVHHGWTPIADGCVAGEGDTTIPLD